MSASEVLKAFEQLAVPQKIPVSGNVHYSSISSVDDARGKPVGRQVEKGKITGACVVELRRSQWRS